MKSARIVLTLTNKLSRNKSSEQLEVMHSVSGPKIWLHHCTSLTITHYSSVASDIYPKSHDIYCKFTTRITNGKIVVSSSLHFILVWHLQNLNTFTKKNNSPFTGLNA